MGLVNKVCEGTEEPRLSVSSLSQAYPALGYRMNIFSRDGMSMSQFLRRSTSSLSSASTIIINSSSFFAIGLVSLTHTLIVISLSTGKKFVSGLSPLECDNSCPSEIDCKRCMGYDEYRLGFMESACRLPCCRGSPLTSFLMSSYIQGRPNLILKKVWNANASS